MISYIGSYASWLGGYSEENKSVEVVDEEEFQDCIDTQIETESTQVKKLTRFISDNISTRDSILTKFRNQS